MVNGNGKTRKSLVDMLVAAKLVTSQQAEHLRLMEQTGGRKAIDILKEDKSIDPEQLALVISVYLGIPFVNLKRQMIDPKAVDMVPEWICRKYRLIPVSRADGGVRVAMEDPNDIQALDEVGALIRGRVEPVFALSQDIQDAIDRNFRIGSEIAVELRQMPSMGGRRQEDESEDAAAAVAIAEAPIVRAVDLLIRQAARDRASDVHIEPHEREVRVRFRIDSILHETMSLPSNVHSALVSRIKIIAGMNIAETRRPQDGQISIRDANRELDVRVATAPTVHGELVNLRILDKTFAFRTLPELGFLPQPLASFQELLKLPFGMIAISGPTGSGKTTTLYAAINQLDHTSRNIITIEDPVEYRFNKINQMQVNPPLEGLLLHLDFVHACGLTLT